MPTLHVVTTKQFTFRGQPERFSNGYNFQLGSNDPTEALVASICREVREIEMRFHASEVKFPYLVGGLLGEDAIWSEELTTGIPQGALTAASMHPETVVMAESKLKNRVYLRKFFHTRAHTGDGRDGLDAPARTAIDAHLLDLTDGSLPGGVQLCYPNGALATAPMTCDGFLRTRQLKRRGRRPTPSG